VAKQDEKIIIIIILSASNLWEWLTETIYTA